MSREKILDIKGKEREKNVKKGKCAEIENMLKVNIYFFHEWTIGFPSKGVRAIFKCRVSNPNSMLLSFNYIRIFSLQFLYFKK